MKRIKLLLCAFAAFALFAFGSANAKSAVQVLAEGSEATSLVDSESEDPFRSGGSAYMDDAPEAEAETQADKEAIGVINAAGQWIEEKIVPLFGGVSLVSVLGIVTSVALAVAKFKKDKGNSTLIDSLIAANEALKEKVGSMESQIKLLNEAITKDADRKHEILRDADAIAAMNSCVFVLCDLTAKALSMSEDAVKSGVAESARTAMDALKEKILGGQEDVQEG